MGWRDFKLDSAPVHLVRKLMKTNIEVTYAPDGEVVEILLPKDIQALPLKPRRAIWDEVAFMIEGLNQDEGGKPYEE